MGNLIIFYLYTSFPPIAIINKFDKGISLYYIDWIFLSPSPCSQSKEKFLESRATSLFPSATKLNRTKFKNPWIGQLSNSRRDFLSRKSSPRRRPRVSSSSSSSSTFPSRYHFSTLVSPSSPFRFEPAFKNFPNVSFLPFSSSSFSRHQKYRMTNKRSSLVQRSSTVGQHFFFRRLINRLLSPLPPSEMPLIPVTRVLHRVCAQFWWDKRA